MDASRPLRWDAERNRQRILRAVWEVFNERGLEVSLDDVARHAGVGAGVGRGTVYRRMVEMLAGDVGLQPTDIAFIIFTLAEATQFGRAVSPQIWRRYFNIFLDGLRPEREGVTPLPVPALLPEEMESTMRLNAPRHR